MATRPNLSPRTDPTRRANAHRLGAASLDAWADSPRGQALLQAERRALQACLPALFGRTIVQLGSWAGGEQSLIDAAQMPIKIVLGTADSVLHGEDVRCDEDALPLAKGQVDAVLLPHALEHARSPHRLLRLAENVLSPRGYVLILGFNPLSVWGARHCVRARWLETLRIQNAALPQARGFLSVHRIIDWLRVLDCEPVAIHRFGAGFPWLPPTSSDDHFGFRRVGGLMHEGYLLCARKRTIPLTPAQSRLRANTGQVANPGLAGAVRVNFPHASKRRDQPPR